jgi:hypothetical protein
MIGELSLRIVHYFKWKRPLFFADKGTAEPLYPEKKLGWRATEGYFSQWIAYDAAGKPYQVRGTTDQNGFRFFGNPDFTKIKIFVLGDSYTQAVEVSNEKTYYALLAENFNNLELFVYGGGGYSTLQEYLILDEFINRKINIGSDAFMHRAYLRSVDTTSKIMAMIKKRTPGVEIFTFCADAAQPFYDEMRKLSEESGFHFIDGVPQAIREAEKQGKVTKHA